MTDAQHAKRIRAARDRLIKEMRAAQQDGLSLWWSNNNDDLKTDTRPELDIEITRSL